MKKLQDFQDLQKYSRKILNEPRHRIHRPRYQRVDSPKFEDLPVETRIRIMKRMLDSFQPKHEEHFFVEVFGEPLEISKSEFEKCSELGMNCWGYER